MTGLPFTLDVDELIDAITWGDAVIGSLDELCTAMMRCGRNAGPRILNDLWWEGVLDPHWMPQLVPDAWCDAEFPLLLLEREEWAALFEEAGYTVDGKRRARPRNPVVLYRGAVPGYADGWAWTPDRVRAQWFADRPHHQGRGRVYVAEVLPHQLLAKIRKGRNENEVVVNTDGLAIREVERELIEVETA